MDYSFLIDTINVIEMVHCIYLRGYRLKLPNKIVFLSLKIVFVLVNIVDHDKMPHYRTSLKYSIIKWTDVLQCPYLI